MLYNISMEKISEKKRFSIIARVRSANYAFRGFVLLLKTSHNFLGHIFFMALAVYLGFILHISSVEWVLIVITTGLVLITEALNSAFEIDINLTSPEYHPYARDTKDIAAAAVLISVLVSIVVGLIIFLPKIYLLFFLR